MDGTLSPDLLAAGQQPIQNPVEVKRVDTPHVVRHPFTSPTELFPIADMDHLLSQRGPHPYRRGRLPTTRRPNTCFAPHGEKQARITVVTLKSNANLRNYQSDLSSTLLLNKILLNSNHEALKVITFRMEDTCWMTRGLMKRIDYPHKPSRTHCGSHHRISKQLL